MKSGGEVRRLALQTWSSAAQERSIKAIGKDQALSIEMEVVIFRHGIHVIWACGH